MIDYETFSSLRLEVIFPQHSALFLPDKSGGDAECYGGLWERDRIEGVEFGFPRSDPTKLGYIHLDYSTGDDVSDFCDPKDHPYGALYRKELPDQRKADCSEVIRLIRFPLSFGSAVAAFEQVFPEIELLDQHRNDRFHSDFFLFFTPDPARYLCGLFYSDKLGLTRLEVVREDLRLRNEALNSEIDQD